jgi:hypothetical protein
MQYTYADSLIGLPVEHFLQPEGIVVDSICVGTKKKAQEWCPEKTTEYFNEKYPIGQCDRHTSAFAPRRQPGRISW